MVLASREEGAHGVDLYIDGGDAEENKGLYDYLHSRRQAIEEEYGSTLEWERLDDKQASRVAVYIDGSIEDHRKTWTESRAG